MTYWLTSQISGAWDLVAAVRNVSPGLLRAIPREAESDRIVNLADT